jgi:cephalosporin hydroxylase
MNEFEKEVAARLVENGKNDALHKAAYDFMISTIEPKYSYNFAWLGRPIIQLPQDIVAMQELIWKVKPDLIIETGIAHGGSLIFSASMLAMLDYCEALENGQLLDPKKPKRRVIAVDIDIRQHNRVEIEKHPMANRIDMIQGSSIDPQIVSEIYKRAKESKRIMVCLDSNHTHSHVLAELQAYAPLVAVDSYCVVFDTFDIPKEFLADRPWGPGDNAGTAVDEYLLTNNQFVIDKDIDNKLILSVAPRGYLKRIK